MRACVCERVCVWARRKFNAKKKLDVKTRALREKLNQGRDVSRACLKKLASDLYTNANQLN